MAIVIAADSFKESLMAPPGQAVDAFYGEADTLAVLVMFAARAVQGVPPGMRGASYREMSTS